MKKNLLTLLLIFCSLSPILANSVTIGENSSSGSRVLPITTASSNNSGSVYASFSQLLYTADELNAETDGAKDLTAITFYKKAGANNAAENRNLQVWIFETEKDSFEINVSDRKFKVQYVKIGNVWTAGTKVFEGMVDIGSNSSYTIEFNQNENKFAWSGSKNIVLTIFDVTNTNVGDRSIRHYGISSTNPRFIHHFEEFTVSSPSEKWVGTSDLYLCQKGDYWLTTTSSSLKDQCDGHKFIPKITFTYTSPQPPATPTGLDAEYFSNSANLSWSAVAGATSYKLQSSANGSDWNDLASPSSNSYEWTGLTPETTYYVKVAATNAQGDSEYSSPINFTTDAVHTHHGITFSKWTKSDEMPLSGNYYLANDVTIGGTSPQTTSGDLNLCLNGHSITFGSYTNLTVSDGHSMALYDNVGGGLITGSHGSYTIAVYGPSGSLAVHGGNVANSGEGKAISADGAVSIDLTEAASNDSYLAIAEGNLNVSVNMTRSFTLSQYNTICLPFELHSTELQNIFGSGYDLEQFTGSNLNGDELVLNFTKVTTLEAGEPYLIKPALDVVNPTFANVGINSNLYPQEDDANISFYGTYSPTALQSDPNILFLGANNELFWPQAAGNIGGFRAYFMLKGEAQAATRARIVKQEDDATGVENVSANTGGSEKLMRNGELLIIRDGKTYNALGQIVK